LYAVHRLIEKKRHPVTPVHFTKPFRWRQVLTTRHDLTSTCTFTDMARH